MFKMMKRHCIFLLLVLGISGALFFSLVKINKANACQLIPREVLFGKVDQIIDPTISPDGKYIAYLAPKNGIMNLWIRPTGENEGKAITNLEQDIESYIWLYDNSQILYITNKSLYGYVIKDGSIQEYISLKKDLYFPYYNQFHSNRIIIGMSTSYSPWFDFYELNLVTKDLKLISEKSDKMTKWIPDPQLVIRGKIELLPEGGALLFVRDSLEDPWRLLLKTENDWSGLTFFSKDAKYIYYFADLKNATTRKFIKIDVLTGVITELASDPEYDIFGELLFDNNTLEPMAIAYTKSQRHWVFFSKEIEKLFEIFKTIEKGTIEVKSRTLDDTQWLLAFTKDTGLVSYWLFDRTTNKSTFLFDQKPILKNYMLASIKPIEFITRDGLLIHGYLTYPCDSKKNNIPLVVVVQDDSWLRNTSDFNPIVQWLANRGYAILQVNSRGTAGYGKNFLNAGNKQWGQLIQNDLTDAVHWAIDKKIADPKRIAIFGTSYGGYAALMGAIVTPNLFQCAIDVAGPVDLTTFVKSFSPYWTKIFNMRVGNPNTQEEFLKSISPLYSIDAIKIPILIAQGANDTRVKQTETNQIVEAMKAKGLEYEYLLFPDEEHGIIRQENKMNFYKAAEKFLAKYLGGSYEA